MGLAAAGRRETSRSARLWEALRAIEQRQFAHQAAVSDALSRLERRVGEHDRRINELPPARDLVSLIDELLDLKLSALDRQLNVQRTSLEILKNAISQTDTLLDRLLVAVDSLRVPESGQETPSLPNAPAPR